MDKIKSWISRNKLELGILVAILLIGAFSRLYKIDQYMTFLGDEGRDVIIVRRIFTELHPPLIGPGTSIGNMYLGPLYYYMMAIPLLLANFNPVGPAIFIAILGIVTIFFLWYVVREFYPTDKINRGALVASFLYAISPVVIIYSRASWNPNIMPFFSLLTIYSIWRVWYRKQPRWMVMLFLSFAFVIQSHYLGLLLVPPFTIIWFIAILKTSEKKVLLKYSIVGFVLFLILMSPLAIFDVRHELRNFNAMKEFFTARQTTVSIKPWNAIPAMWPIFKNITTDIVAAKNQIVGEMVAALVFIYFVFVFFLKKQKYNFKKVSVIFIISLWLVFGLLGLGLYKQNIYDHYYGFLFVVPFIVIAAFINEIFELKNLLKRNLGIFLTVLFVIAIMIVNISNSPLRQSPNKQMQRSQNVAKLILEKAEGQRFNIATISERNNRDVYQYFLSIWGGKVVDTDPNVLKYTVTDQLFVVCEKDIKDCDPVHDPSTWVANFGWSKVLDTWNVDGITIFKLGHSK